MKHLIKPLFLCLLTFSLIFTASCKDQCQILQEKIVLCKEDMNCSSNSPLCNDVTRAEQLIKTINNKITENTEDKTSIEAACSYSLTKINFNDCINADSEQEGKWQDLKYLMSNFGIEGGIDKVNTDVYLNLNMSTETEATCGPKILKEYENINLEAQKIKMNLLTSFSQEVTSLIEINTGKTFSNLYIGKPYVKNEVSTCDFNENNRFNLNYNDYDYIFCSKSSGWLSETDITRSNCALTRMEVFLINWSKDYLTDFCLKNMKNNTTHCKQGNDYKCIYTANNICYNIKDRNYCTETYKTCKEACSENTIKNCQETCQNNYLSCLNDDKNYCQLQCQTNNCLNVTTASDIYSCIENSNYSCCNCEVSCSESCNDPTTKACRLCKDNCLMNCIDNNQFNMYCYEENLGAISQCLSTKINAGTSSFSTCAQNQESSCSSNCQYRPCMQTCLQDKCNKRDCLERSNTETQYFSSKSCNEYSCYQECQKECVQLKADPATSQVMTLYREVKDDEITGSNCDETEIFTLNKTTNKYNKYCTIDQHISN